MSTNVDKARVHHPLKSYASGGGSKCLCENNLYQLIEALATSVNHPGKRKSANRFVSKYRLVAASRLYRNRNTNSRESAREGVTYGL